jgi:hypothetical protein
MPPRRPSKEREIDLSDIPEIDFAKATVVGRGLMKDKRIPLRGLRVALGKTQVEIARAAEMSQGDLSRLEHRGDALLSTLLRYVHAVGGELELVAVFPTGHRIKLAL